MRVVLWILGLFAAAVAVALLAVSNDGTVSIFLPTRRIDVSLNLALLVLVLAFALVHTAINALRTLFALPAQSRQWRSLQRERGAHAALLDAWIFWRSGRYSRAREAAKLALARERALREAGESLQHGAAMQALAHTLLAESAYALREPQERDAQLAQGLAVDRDSGSTHLLTETQHGLHLRAAHWALVERDPARAARHIHDMGRGARRRTAALRILAQAAEMGGRPLEAFELTRLLRKHGDLSDDAALHILLPLAEAAAVQAPSIKALRAIRVQLAPWHSTPSSEAELALFLPTELKLVARAVQLPQGAAQANAWLSDLWDAAMQNAEALPDALWEPLVGTLEAVLVAIDGTPDYALWLTRIATAQQQWPQVVALQYLQGMAALSQSQWDEGRRWLAQSALTLPSPHLQRQAWRALARLADAQGRADEARDAWQHAAMVD